MITQEEIDKYRDYPEGSNSKKLYDYYSLSFEEFLIKYYKKPDLIRWKYIYDKFVNPIFTYENESEYKSFLKQAKPNFSVSIIKAHEFYEIIKNDNRFDAELKYFFSFLYSINFFRELTFENWLETNYWNHPWHHENDSNLLPIILIIKHEYGLNFLKDQLSMLTIF